MVVRARWTCIAVALLVATPLFAAPATGSVRTAGSDATGHPVGLGEILTSADGGQIFGWDINENGTDGVLATSQPKPHGKYQVSVETFDQVTATITGSFAEKTGRRDSYGVDGIFAGDVALVTHYVVPKGTIYAKRRYKIMNPVTAQEFTGRWTPPVKQFDVIQNADNQTTTSSVVYGIELNSHSHPAVVVSDLTADTSQLFRLDPSRFGLGNGTKVAQDTTRNRAVLASSPDYGTVGGLPPVNALVNLSTGHVTEWNGLNNGPFGAGYVNGLAVDSTTGIACTTTELNAQVEFYNLRDRTGIAVQLPGTQAGDQLNSGAAVVNDPVHGLFLVAN